MLIALERMSATKSNRRNAGVIDQKTSQSHSTDLQAAIRRRISERTGGQIQSLEIAVEANRIVISGIASSYYHKQLAVEGTLESIGPRNGIGIEVNIEVVGPPPGRGEAYPAIQMEGDG
ncbi:MAG: hypothetical protein AB7F89_26385 [Pirellulaceae bacterium]